MHQNHLVLNDVGVRFFHRLAEILRFVYHKPPFGARGLLKIFLPIQEFVEKAPLQLSNLSEKKISFVSLS